MARAAETEGWFIGTNGTSPPVGSPPVAAEAYRTIAYEICEQLGGRAPDSVVMPVFHGDCLAGLRHGFAHMTEIGRIERPPRYTTDQAVRAPEAANGVAVTVPENEFSHEQHRFARLSGLYAEVSSSITIAAARRLVGDGTIDAGANVVCLLTATGLNDPAATLRSHSGL